jgi:hypothetical protein
LDAFFRGAGAAMTKQDLLSAVLSAQGWYCVVGLKKTGLPKQVFVRSLEEVEGEVSELLSKNYDVYFACAKYDTNKTRSTDNVTAIKAFWLDIDCGVGKPYETQADGIAALKAFCSSVGLPKPTLVNSGRGVHVYWPLTADVTRQQWKPVADRLKVVCHERGLDADPSRTADAASILRVPETFNYKGDPPLDVSLINVSKPVDFEEFKSKLGVINVAPAHIPTQINDLTRALMGNKQHRFSIIVDKNAKGTGCFQLAKAIAEQETLDEPRWRAALSIPAFCIDADTAIHDISSKHPDYSPKATEEKVQKIKGPYTCEKFEATNPGGCANCIHKGKITSPIVLGAEIAEATEQDNEIEVVTETAKTIKYVVPEYPFPYFRGKTGGVYRKSEDEDDPDAVMIYEHDLYVVKRMKDPQHGEVIWMRLHTPRDGVKEFALPAVDLLTADKLREKLAWFGVIGMKKQMDNIMSYIVRFVKELQCREGAEIMRSQFGWTDKNQSFVVGDTEISAGSESYSPPSSYTAQLSDWFVPVGSLDEWKSVINVYNKPGFEPHAFGFFTAFGAPLMKHINLKGAIINMINNTSGTGKTTTIKAMHSVYGHPEELMLIQRDTMNVRLHRLGVMNNLGLGCDEITKMSSDDFSDFAYAVSQGRGRGRMKSNENAERLNTAKWQTILLCSSNASAVDKLRSLKSTPDGELMRLIEYEIPETKLLSKQEADEIYPKLYTNYGHAGRIYIRDLVENLEERIREIKEIQVMIDNKVGFTNRERFWSGVAACNIAGALFAKRLGLIDIDVGRVFKWMLTEFSQMRQEIKPPASNHASIIGEYWNEHRRNTLVINDQVDKRTGVEMLPILEPYGELIIRMEPDTLKLFIIAKKFRKWCSEHQITIKDVLNSLTADSVYVGTVKKRMAKGTKLGSVPPVDAYVFDCSKGDFIDPDIYIEAAKNDTPVEEDADK